MYIGKIHIENFGSIDNFEAKFDKGLNVISSEFWSDILAVLGIVTGSRVVGFNFTRYVFRTDARINAVLCGNFGSADIELFYDENCTHNCGRNIIINGKKVAEDDFNAVIGIISERQECSVYINGNDYRRYVSFADCDFVHRLESYLQRQARCNDKEDVVGSPRFNVAVQDFISAFKFVPINSSKDIWLSITKDGVFVPLCRGEVRHDLSVSEREIFNYLCFAEVNRFWGQVADKCSFAEQLPLYIGDFMCYIDEAIDITPLIDRVLALCRQTFLFCHDRYPHRCGATNR